MADFLQNLRMNGIFGGSQPFGMPDLSAGQVNPMLMRDLFDRRDYERKDQQNFQREMFDRQQKAHLGEIAANLKSKQDYDAAKPMNYVVAPSAADNRNPIDVFSGESPQQRNQLELQKAALQQKGDIAENKQEIDRSKVGISQQRADVYKFKAEHPGMKILAPKGGNFTAVDPITGKTMDLGIDTGTFTDAEKTDITNENQLGQIEARGNIQKDIQGTRGEQNLAGIAARIQGQQDINAAKPGKDMLPTQVNAQQKNKARELANTRPDLAKFLQIDPNGNFTVESPGNSFFTGPSGPNPAQQKEIQDFIYGSPTTPKSTTPVKPTVKPSTKKETPTSKYKVTVED